MEKKLSPELKALKEEYDFLHKKIGELEWEIATIYLGRKAIAKSEREDLEHRLDNYLQNISLLLEKVKEEVSIANQSNK